MEPREVVRRVLPLLERLSPRTLDKARLLQYLSARAAADWQMLTFLGEETHDGEPVLVFRDRLSGERRLVRQPDCLPPTLADDVLAEYKRLALATPLTVMNSRLFDHFFRADYCARCRYDRADARQVCRECHFAGQPINFEQ